MQGLIDVVHLILQTPNVVGQKDGQRDTPLRLARRCGRAQIAQLLLDAGAKESASAAVSQDLTPGTSCTGCSMVHAPAATELLSTCTTWIYCQHVDVYNDSTNLCKYSVMSGHMLTYNQISCRSGHSLSCHAESGMSYSSKPRPAKSASNLRFHTGSASASAAEVAPPPGLTKVPHAGSWAGPPGFGRAQ